MPAKSVEQAQAILRTMRPGNDMPSWTPTARLYLGDPRQGGAEVSSPEYAGQPYLPNDPQDEEQGVFNTTRVTFGFPVLNWGVIEFCGLEDQTGVVRYAQQIAGTVEERTVTAGGPEVAFEVGTMRYHEV